MKPRVEVLLFMAAVVIGVTFAARSIGDAIGIRAERGVYGGTIGLLSAMYWQQRQVNAFLLKSIGEISDMVKGWREEKQT